MNRFAPHYPPLGRPLLAGLVLFALAAPMVMAQGVYRIVGPDGRVTYSDQPPAPNANAKPVTGLSGAATGSATAQLPAALRKAANQYPVTLYTGDECAPCISGRNMLNARGIPYAEKTITSDDDVDAIKRLSGGSSLPLLTIGGQQIKGFSATEWNQFLDAAGYPKESVLPANYRRPAATALVEAKPVVQAPAKPPAPARAPRAAETTETPVVPPQTNPGGIRF
jgi:glutaredoxin